MGRGMTSRRSFMKKTAAAAAAATATAIPVTAQTAAPAAAPGSVKLKLGFDNFSIRALGWKAPALIDYAGEQKVDVLLMSDLDVYEKMDDSYLADLAKRAKDKGVQLYAG